MSTTKNFKHIRRTIELSSSGPKRCNECGINFQDVNTGINHFLSKHEYELLNVGTETDGKESSTVAILGSKQ